MIEPADAESLLVAEVRENFARLGLRDGVEFVPGFFEDTLPGLADRRRAVVRLDADTYEPIDFTASRWRRAGAAPIRPAPRPPRPRPSRPVHRPPAAVRVPTAAELELARERDALEARLAVAEAAIGLRPWLRRKLGRSAAR